MLETTRIDGLTLLRSPLLARAGILHAFTTRQDAWPGGDPFDLADARSDGYRRVLNAVGAPGAAMSWVRQCHGRLIETVDGEASQGRREADALVTRTAGAALAIRTADCAAILVASGDGGAVAAIHAGWRGVVAGIIPAAIDVLREQGGVAAADMLAAIGPCISGTAYEVGDEVATAFVDAGLSAAVLTQPGKEKPHVDLAAAAAIQLASAGVRNHNIDRTDLCTFRDGDMFFSYRREGSLAGRMAAVIVRPG